MSLDTPIFVPADIQAFHQGLTVVDSHHDIPIDILARRRRGEHSVLARVWGPRLRQAGVDVQVFPVAVETPYLPELALRSTLQQVQAYHSDLGEDSSIIAHCTTRADMRAALAAGKIAAFLGLEGCEALGYDIEILLVLHQLGVRFASFTWNRRTALADGVDEAASGGGLTALGREAVREMNRLHMVVDVSHVSERGFFDMLSLSQQPVIASHSNARGVCDHKRNLTDDQIRALAANGGVMGMLLMPPMIDPSRPTVSRCVDHIAYIADLVGVEHVGMGTDLQEDAIGVLGPRFYNRLLPGDMDSPNIEGMDTILGLPLVTQEMLQRGFSRADVALVMGGNFLRVFEHVLA